MRQDRLAEALSITEGVVSDFELDRSDMKRILMKCLHLATLIQDDELYNWMQLELCGYGNINSEDAKRAAELAGRWYTYIENDVEKKQCHTTSLPELTELISVKRTVLQLQKISDSSQTIELVNHLLHIESNLGQDIRTTEGLVSRIEGKIYDYVVRIFNELKYSSYIASALDQMRTAVDKRLKDICPKALNQFAAAFDSGLSGNCEHWAQALSSCRRILESTADALFPASEEEVRGNDDKQHDVTQDKYVNRLCAFVREHSRSNSSAELIMAKIKALYDKVCKGVHDSINELELQLALTETYFLVGELLALCPAGFVFNSVSEQDDY